MGNLRDPDSPQVTFASESFIDELAAAAKADPIAFRLNLLERGKMDESRKLADGSLLSFETGNVELSRGVVERTKLFAIAVSFGANGKRCPLKSAVVASG